MIASILLCRCGGHKIARERICRACRDQRMLIASGVLRPREERRISLNLTSVVNIERRRVDARMTRPKSTQASRLEEQALAWHGANDDTMPMFEEAR